MLRFQDQRQGVPYDSDNVSDHSNYNTNCFEQRIIAGDDQCRTRSEETESMNYKGKALGYLIPLAVVDAVIPVPIVGLMLIYVILVRPQWFFVLTEQIYDRPGGNNGTD